MNFGQNMYNHNSNSGQAGPASSHTNQHEHLKLDIPQPYVEGIIKLTDVITCPSEVMCVRFNIDASLLAVGLADGCTKIYSCDTTRCLYSLTDDEIQMSRLPVTSLHFCPFPLDVKVEHKHILMTTYAATGSKGTVKFWHYTSGACLQTIREKRQTLTSALNTQGSAFVTAGAQPEINLYDLETKKLISSMAPSDSRVLMNGHRSRVFAMKYHPTDTHTFVSGGWDDTVQFWDDRQQHAIGKIFGPHICGDSLDIDGTHNHLLTGSWRKERTLQIWDFRKCELLKEVPQDPLNTSLLYCAQWLGREFMICGGCENNMLKIIDRGTLSNLGQLLDLPKGVYCLDQDRYNTRPRIAAGSACHIYMLRLEKRQ